MIMNETYEGQVEYVGEDTVVVVYNVEGSLVEQTYLKKQFLDGKLPELGACLRITVVVTEFEPELPPYDEIEKPTNRRPLTGPERL